MSPMAAHLIRTTYFSTVDLAPVMPILASSPTIRGDPQVEFAADIWRMSCRTSLETGSRPGLPRRLSRRTFFMTAKGSRGRVEKARGRPNVRL